MGSGKVAGKMHRALLLFFFLSDGKDTYLRIDYCVNKMHFWDPGSIAETSERVAGKMQEGCGKNAGKFREICRKVSGILRESFRNFAGISGKHPQLAVILFAWIVTIAY